MKSGISAKTGQKYLPAIGLSSSLSFACDRYVHIPPLELYLFCFRCFEAFVKYSSSIKKLDIFFFGGFLKFQNISELIKYGRRDSVGGINERAFTI